MVLSLLIPNGVAGYHAEDTTVDQVPCPFVICQDQTHEEKGNNSVWISQPGSVSRFCLLINTDCTL